MPAKKVDYDLENQLIDQFEDEIKAGNSPEIESYLLRWPKDARQEALFELITIEIFHNVERNRVVANSDYGRFGAEALRHAEEFRNELITQQPKTHCSANDSVCETIEQSSLAPNLKHGTRGKIGPYQLIAQLGEGGMGTVWLAEQNEPVKRRVAVKLIKSDLSSAEIIARFDAEKQALAMMNHPNIAKVLDAGTTENGRPYFAMELVNGIPITDYCDENKLSVDERLMLFVPVCKAVQHAHQKGILHRDLKPSNVLVAKGDGEAVPKVIDFGMAKAIEQDLKLTERTVQTEFGRILGTLQYMSPEQAKLDSADVDTRTDVYSLGVMLYELLSGSTPLDKKTLGENAFLKALEIIREKDPPKPSSKLNSSSIDLNTQVSDVRRISPARLQQILAGELDWVVMKALEKDRSRRYQTANDFAQDISNYLAGNAVLARPPSAWYQFQKFATRHRGLVASILLIGAALVAGIIGTSYGLIHANRKAIEAKSNLELANAKTEEATRNEGRAAIAEKLARDSAAAAKFQLAVARFDANRALEARGLLREIPIEYRDNFEWHYCNRRFLGGDITCYGHTGDFDFGSVYEVAYSPNGKWVASAGGDSTIRLWDSKTGKELATLEGHTDGVVTLDVSPDGTLIASGGFGNLFKLWDAKTLNEISTFDAHSDIVNCVRFSPDGNTLVSASNDKTIKIWDVKNGEEVATIAAHSKGVNCVAFSPDGRQVASAGLDLSVKVWDVQTQKEIVNIRKLTTPGYGIAFSPDGNRLVATSYSKVTLFDSQTWQYVAEDRSGHDRFARCVEFSPDGSQFAIGADDSTIRFYDTRTGQKIYALSGHGGPVLGLAYSPDGEALASGSRDRTVKLWNLNHSNVRKLTGHLTSCTSVAFSPDGIQFASAENNGTIFIWDVSTNEKRFTLKGHRGSVEGLAFSPNGKLLASASYDRTIRVWNTKDGELVSELLGHTSWVRDVMFSPNSKQIASAGWDKTIKIWNVKSWEESASLTGHRGGIYCVAFSPDGEQLASASFDKTIRLWDLKTRKEIRTFSGHTKRARSVAFGPNGKRIVSTGNDGTVRTWDLTSGRQIAIGKSDARFFDLALSPDGKRIAVASTDKEVNLFDSQTGLEILDFPAGEGGVGSVAFSSDGTRLAAAIHTGEIRIWEAHREPKASVLGSHSDEVTSVSFSADGSRVYSESRSERLVWDVETRQTIGDAQWTPTKHRTQTSPDGRWFITREQNHILLIDQQE